MHKHDAFVEFVDQVFLLDFDVALTHFENCDQYD